MPGSWVQGLGHCEEVSSSAVFVYGVEQFGSFEVLMFFTWVWWMCRQCCTSTLFHPLQMQAVRQTHVILNLLYMLNVVCLSLAMNTFQQSHSSDFHFEEFMLDYVEQGLLQIAWNIVITTWTCLHVSGLAAQFTGYTSPAAMLLLFSLQGFH